MDLASLLDEHRQAGRVVDVAGVATFVREQGSGEPVLLVHGVPVSSWLWRRMLPALANRGLRAVAPDLPGLGLSARPTDFDYSWTGLGRHLAATVDALDLDGLHMVVHDIGGPVGFEAAAVLGSRVRTITVLDTVVEAHTFRKPWAMRPFEHPVLGEVWLRATPRPVFRLMMRRLGLESDTTVSAAEIDVHHALLRRGDGGAAFLRIMRSFETTQEKTTLYKGVLRSADRRVQVLWGKDDPALRADHHGRIAARAAGLDAPELLRGRHFLMEDVPELIADRVVALAAAPPAA
jgi:pimeloyl-ACP methyl ester carboxylesterase